MILTPVANGVEVSASAKLNLFLEVLARRPDGFHEIETLMVAIGISDRLRVEATTDGQVSLRCQIARGLQAYQSAEGRSDSLIGDIPTGQGNLAAVAVERLREAAGVTPGARITLWKRIPAAAGLGGASSDAAAALAAANRVWQLKWDDQQLSDVAASVGSDIPFFLRSSAAICRGRGELIEDVPMHHRFYVVVVRPPAGLHTATVYRQCQPAQHPASVQPLLSALRLGDLAAAARHMNNGLQPAAMDLSPWIPKLRDAFDQVGCLGHQMSGSGTSYFGICHHRHHARRVAARLRSRGFGFVRVTSTSTSFGKTQIASSQR
jgi:4-diphosphocytidyl-2-C-methyl-D-erythritol kinase